MWKLSTAGLLALIPVAFSAETTVLPQAELREMNALYTSPYTVNVGHVQIESYLIGYAYAQDDGGNTRITIWNIAPMTAKYGLSNSVDVELALNPYTYVQTEDRRAHVVNYQRGFGDIVLKTKLNLWGNDCGATALALLPFLKFPTAQDALGNGAFEGGLGVPFGVELPRGWWLFLSPELSAVPKATGRGYTAAFRDIACFWHAIVGQLSGYVEFSNWLAFDVPDDWYGTVDLGCTYMATKNVQIDLGVLLGVTRTAPDVNPFLGFSIRF